VKSIDLRLLLGARPVSSPTACPRRTRSGLAAHDSRLHRSRSSVPVDILVSDHRRSSPAACRLIERVNSLTSPTCRRTLEQVVRAGSRRVRPPSAFSPGIATVALPDASMSQRGQSAAAPILAEVAFEHCQFPGRRRSRRDGGHLRPAPRRGVQQPQHCAVTGSYPCESAIPVFPCSLPATSTTPRSASSPTDSR
jgi:hypothetical protein